MEKYTRKNIISAIITTLILALGVVAYLSLSAEKKSTVSNAPLKKERRKVKFENFSATTVPNLVTIDGRLNAQERVNITSKVQGVMTSSSRTIREGSYVKRGDLLFVVDNQEASFDLKAQKSNLLTAIAGVMPDMKFDYPDAYPVWLEYLNSFNVDASIQPLPAIKNESLKYLIAAKNIQSQYYNIKSMETRLKEYNIYAPFSGYVTAVNVFPGALISPGQVLASMINASTFEVESPISLSELKYVSVGQTVELTSPDLDAQWTGKVNRIGTVIDPTTQNIPIYINVSGQGLKDGMYLEGELKGKDLEEVTKLPKSIFLTPNSIYTIEDSTLVATEITPVKRYDNYVLVRDLSPDKKVVVGSLAGLFEGQKVNY